MMPRNFRDLPPRTHNGQPVSPRRQRNAMIAVAVLFALLVGCTVWLSSGNEPPSESNSELIGS